MLCLGSSCHVITAYDNVVHGILYQDKEMKDMFQSFPEVLFVDATYHINNLQMALYVLLVEDGNGESEIVGFWLLREETAEMISAAVNQFVSENPATAQVQVIMADKDFVERESFAASFPNATIHICCFHTLRTFRREVTVDKMNITAAQRDKALDFLQRMTYEAVDVSAIYHFLTLPARRALRCKMSRLQKQPWVCAVCEQSLDDVRCVACDRCLQWFHYHCQSLSTTPTSSTYFCTMCIRT